MAKSKVKDDRIRNFACVVYEDSAPKIWRDIISNYHVPVYISPYHDRDINPTGEPKKPHWHVMFMFEGKKSLEQIREIFQSFGGVGLEVVMSMRGYARYLCHLDNPEKAQYSVDDVVSYGGADYYSTIGLALDKYNAIAEMIDFVNEFNILYYSDLMTYARFNHFDWFRVLCDCGSYVVSSYIKENRKKILPKSDSNTDDL